LIYFIKSPDGPIKIGTTIRLSERLKKLAAEYGEGLEVLAVTEGDRDIEQELHERFSYLRRVGEWFEPGDDLVGFIVAEGKPWDGADEVDPARPVRLDLAEADHNRLENQARKLGLSKSSYARMAVLERIKIDEGRP
jgi:T5orf172 domain